MLLRGLIAVLTLSVVLASEGPIAKEPARIQPVRFAVMTTKDHPECILLGRQTVKELWRRSFTVAVL
jgi:hypothetical protein